jgi:hypothetical protein
MDMDSQSLINIGIALAGFFGGWVLNRITNSLDRLDDDMKKMPEKYVLKDDYRSDISEIKLMLKSIYDKLDHKVDK